MHKILTALTCSLALALSPLALADDTANSTQALENAMTDHVEVGYYDIKPEIVTNLAQSSPSEKLHYVRLKAVIMIENNEEMASIKERDPLIRDAIINILGNKVFSQVNKPSAREEIRDECLKRIQDLLYEKDKKNIVQDFLILNFLYQ